MQRSLLVIKGSNLKWMKDYLVISQSKIEDLALNFTLVGYPEIELIENGNDMPVTLSNLETYITMTLDFFLHKTI